MLMLVACQEELFHLELGWNILNSVIRELYPTWRVSKYGVISDPCFLTEYGDLRRNPIYSIFNPNTGKYGPEVNPYLDTFHAAITAMNLKILPFIAKLKILPFL